MEETRRYYKDDPFAISSPWGDSCKNNFFRDADAQMKGHYLPRPEIVEEPIEVPQEFIRGCEGADPIVYVTKDWYLKKKQKKVEKRKKNMRDYQIDAMELMARQKVIRGKLGRLNPLKTKDANKIVDYNIELRNIEAELDYIKTKAGVPVRELDLGSEEDQKKGRIHRKIKSIKKKIHKKVKKVKKFFRENEETIVQVAAMTIPIILYAFIAVHTAPVAAAAAAVV